MPNTLRQWISYLANLPIDDLRSYAGSSETRSGRRAETSGLSRGELLINALEYLGFNLEISEGAES